jgi:hypothetical protein
MATTKEERMKENEENESDGDLNQDAIAKEAYEREREKQVNERMNIQTQEALGLPVDEEEKAAHEAFFVEDEKAQKKREKRAKANPVITDDVDVEDVVAALISGDLRPNSIATFKIEKENRSLQGGNLTRLITALADGGKIVVKANVNEKLGGAIEQYLGKGRTDGDYIVYKRKKD